MVEELSEPLVTAEPVAPAPKEWEQRGEVLREQEWEVAQQLLSSARALLKRVALASERKKDVSLADIARLLDLASRLGRLASGLATERQELSGPRGAPVPVAIAAALERIYGSAAPEPNSQPPKPNEL